MILSDVSSFGELASPGGDSTLINECQCPAANAIHWYQQLSDAAAAEERLA
jgi:hypothetical protein